MKLFEKLHFEIEKVVTERINEWAKGNKSPPTKVVLHPTERCNLACPFCRGILIKRGIFRKELLQKKNEITIRKWIKIFKEGAEFGVKHWMISGGEPLIRSDVVIAGIRTLKKYTPNSIVEVVTNGWFLNARIAYELINLECDSIIISIDGPDSNA